MEKLNGRTLDLVEENYKNLKGLFPDVVTDGKVDFDKLKSMLGEKVEVNNERYEFTWHGKTESLKLAQTPSTGTLRPDKESSKYWDDTENLYIEGDNLEVLKLLQKSYFGKVKMIYIDPPYNTGHDFVYKDDFRDNIKNYIELTGQSTKSNSETSGRYHTDWLNMIYPRLKLARNLLREDGIIFISIDDNEQSNLKKLMDDIYGEENFIANIIIEGTPKNDPYVASTAHEYCFVYVKNFEAAKKVTWGIENPLTKKLYNLINKDEDYEEAEKKLKDFYQKNNLTKDNISNYKFVDEKGIFRLGPIDDPQDSGPQDTRLHPETGEPLVTPNRGWSCTVETWNQWLKENLIYFPEDKTKLCAKKTYLEIGNLEVLRSVYKFQIRKDTQFLKNLFDGEKVFSYPKPVELIKMFILNSCREDDIVLDFFSGSATTAQAVMEINKEQEMNINYILVQLPEALDVQNANSAKEKKIINNAISFLEGNNKPLNLCEIGKERIRRVGELLHKEETMLNSGFKVFKLDSTNVKPWDPDIEKLEQNLFDLQDNIKEERSKEDLLYEILLKIGMPLTSPIEEVQINDKIIYNVGFGRVLLCLDDEINLEIAQDMIKLKAEDFASKVIFKETGFLNDSVKTNAIQTLKKNGITDVRSV